MYVYLHRRVVHHSNEKTQQCPNKSSVPLSRVTIGQDKHVCRCMRGWKGNINDREWTILYEYMFFPWLSNVWNMSHILFSRFSTTLDQDEVNKKYQGKNQYRCRYNKRPQSVHVVNEVVFCYFQAGWPKNVYEQLCFSSVQHFYTFLKCSFWRLLFDGMRCGISN